VLPEEATHETDQGRNCNLTLPAGKPEHFLWDDALKGFGVRARDGKLTYVAQFRVNGQSRRKTIGSVGKLDLDTARKIARQLFAQAALGVDVAAERRAEKRAAAMPTVGEVADMYCDAKHRLWRPASESRGCIFGCSGRRCAVSPSTHRQR
jgi:Arm DNA-binding domain